MSESTNPKYEENVESFFNHAVYVGVCAPGDLEIFWARLLIILQSILQKTDEQLTIHESLIELYCSHSWSVWSNFDTSSQPTFPIGEFMEKLEKLVKGIEENNKK
jgi:hypothetical protein